MRWLWLGVLVPLLGCSTETNAAVSCSDNPVALQVLGSGGPFGEGRAASGYLLWVDGVARIMVDAGGGTFTSFHASGARIEDLDVLALSHFHPDHSAEVPALLWIKQANMLVAGPTGSDMYPSADEYVVGLFGAGGVFRAVTGGKGLRTISIDTQRNEPTTVFSDDAIKVTALGVPHGIVPAVGYRVDVGRHSVVFSSDQNGSDPTFVDFAANADVLVVHMAVPENVSGFAADLHARPSVWGQLAADAKASRLVVSHLTAVAPKTAEGDDPSLDRKLSALRTSYSGPVLIADDLLCVPLAAD